MDVPATRAAIDRFNEAFNRHDADALERCLTDDTVFEDTSPAPDGRRIQGEHLLRPGEVAQLGASTIVIWQGEQTPASDDARATSARATKTSPACCRSSARRRWPP